FPRILSSATSGTQAPAGYNYTWRDPNIFQEIADRGQTVVSQNVVIVYADQPWQNSGVNIATGQTAWIDTQAVGQWQGALGGSPTD
ncbi:hypothetical protein ABTD73_20175, partial [Acinetobacter baumannii]